MNYRNTPLKDIGLSPAQIIFARNIKDYIPASPGTYKPRQKGGRNYWPWVNGWQTQDQYRVRVDGSGQITLRNRKFLRKLGQGDTSAPTQPLNSDQCQEDGREGDKADITSTPVVLARHLLCTWLELATLMFWEPISDLVISISSFVVFILLSVLYVITLFRSLKT